MKQMQITLPKPVFDLLKAEAETLGITPGILARLKLVEMFHGARWSRHPADGTALPHGDATDEEAADIF